MHSRGWVDHLEARLVFRSGVELSKRCSTRAELECGPPRSRTLIPGKNTTHLWNLKLGRSSKSRRVPKHLQIWDLEDCGEAFVSEGSQSGRAISMLGIMFQTLLSSCPTCPWADNPRPALSAPRFLSASSFFSQAPWLIRDYQDDDDNLTRFPPNATRNCPVIQVPWMAPNSLFIANPQVGYSEIEHSII